MGLDRVLMHYAGMVACERPVARVISLCSSRSHNTELATMRRRSQSPALKATVENAFCRNGMYTTAACNDSDRRDVVARARSRLGERSYRVLTNNCEHFCVWALRGDSRSTQVERLRATPRAMWRALCACVVRLVNTKALVNAIVQSRRQLPSGSMACVPRIACE